MLVGYARISTTDQTLNLQRDALLKAGCSKIFTDTASGAKAEREGLTEALSYVRVGDTLVVWKLDRLGRSLKDLIERIRQLNDRKIGSKSHPFQGLPGPGRDGAKVKKSHNFAPDDAPSTPHRCTSITPPPRALDEILHLT